MNNSVGGEKKIIHESRFVFQSRRSGHKAERYRKRGSLKSRYTHIVCNKRETETGSPNETSKTCGQGEVSLTCNTTYAEEKAAIATIPVSIEG